MPLRECKKILVTGGAGFIGSAFVRYVLKNTQIERVVNLDLLTYAGSLKHLDGLDQDDRHLFVHGDIRDKPLVTTLIEENSIDAVIHFAAESHVDRSIEDPTLFYKTNVEGTITLLEVVRSFPNVHFHHVSTDEVYGSISHGKFTENSPYRPNSPYAASKAASDHFVRAYAKTYGLSTTISHSSNNYGPFQAEEKFIPRMIGCCVEEKALPIYGNGKNVRDWLFVEDHAEALWLILQEGKKGGCFNIGGKEEMQNIDLLKMVISRVASQRKESVEKLQKLIAFVADRPGHDLRYALDCSKLEKTLGWKAKTSLTQGLEKTVAWYVES